MTDSPITAYTALAFQARCFAVNGSLTTDNARECMSLTLDRLGEQLAMMKQICGPDLRLVVLPEYFLTGFPLQETTEDWRIKAALATDEREFARLAQMAVDNELYLSGNAYEVDKAFPDLYFQTGFVIGSDGEFCLRYRRLISLYGPTPIDVWDKYIDTYGLDAIFPVARTPIGNLAAIASEEILYPEIARCHAMKGAEIFLHNTAEFASLRPTPKDYCRVTRAVENMAYVISANSASIEGTPIPHGTTDAMSKIIDYRGLILSEAGYGETMAVQAEIDLTALRRHRAKPGMQNFLSRSPYEAFAMEYARARAYPMNTLLKDGAVQVPERSEMRARQEMTIARMREAGHL